MECTSLHKCGRTGSVKQKFGAFVNRVPLDRDEKNNKTDTFVKLSKGAYPSGGLAE